MPEEPDAIVINTGPLIALGRAGALPTIERLALHFLTPREVAEEIQAGVAAGHPIAMPDWVEVAMLSTPLEKVAVQALDRGEAAVIQLALERSITWVCIDEWRGRRAALACGLRVTGSLGLLGRAKVLGLIPEVRSWVVRLGATGSRYHPALIERFLAELGEGSPAER